MKTIFISRIALTLCIMLCLEYPYTTNEIDERLNWYTWVDPKTCLGADDEKGAVYVGFKGPNRVNAADLAVLCYKMHSDSNNKRAGDMAYMTNGCYCDYVNVKDKEAIISAVGKAIGRLSAYYSDEVKLIRQQLPWLLINPDWHTALLAAPARYIRYCQESELRRRPETYDKLREQADKLYAELQKTVSAMNKLKEELPELPAVPSYNAV